MTTATLRRRRRRGSAFRHEALFYAGEAEFLARVVPFIREGLAAGEPVLVVVDGAKVDLLREILGSHAERVRFSDMAEVGQNPARIIPAWQEFVAEHGDRRSRGIGEPIWPGRGPAELVEWQRHEALLNLAFANSPEWWLLCPYDTGALGPQVIGEARRTHPFVRDGHQGGESPEYRGLEAAVAPFDAPLPEPAGRPARIEFDLDRLGAVREFVSARAAAAGLAGSRAADLVLAVHEVATNSLRHGGGRGTLRVWQEGETLVCEIRDQGQISDPLAGRHRPSSDRHGSRGLWAVNQLCDLVQLRSSPAGSVVRLHFRAR